MQICVHLLSSKWTFCMRVMGKFHHPTWSGSRKNVFIGYFVSCFNKYFQYCYQFFPKRGWNYCNEILDDCMYPFCFLCPSGICIYSILFDGKLNEYDWRLESLNKTYVILYMIIVNNSKLIISSRRRNKWKRRKIVWLWFIEKTAIYIKALISLKEKKRSVIWIKVKI